MKKKSMINRNKIAYKLRFNVNPLNEINKIFNFKSKEFQKICISDYDDFNIITVNENHIDISDHLLGSDEIGFNVIGEIVSNPGNILFTPDYTYYAITLLTHNKIYLINKNDVKKEFIDNIDNILTSNIINELTIKDIREHYLVLNKSNINEIFVDLFEQKCDDSYYDIQEYLHEDKCLKYILENTVFFIKPYDNFQSEYYLIISKYHYDMYKRRNKLC